MVASRGMQSRWELVTWFGLAGLGWAGLVGLFGYKGTKSSKSALRLNSPEFISLFYARLSSLSRTYVDHRIQTAQRRRTKHVSGMVMAQ